MTREEAIEYLVPLKRDAERDDDSYRTEALNMAIEALKHERTDEWCADCKEYDTEKKCCPRFNKVIREAMNDIAKWRTWSHTYDNACMNEPQGDLISRQAAIEALGEEPPVWCDEDYEIAERNQWRADVEAIKSVPSADRPRPIEPTITVDLESGVVPISACEPKAPKTIVYADRPRGEWIETAQDYYETVNKKGGGVNENTEYFTDDIACPNCLAKFSNIDNETERFNFCPNCGAEMRGDTK